jgi:hypothetical protein
VRRQVVSANDSSGAQAYIRRDAFILAGCGSEATYVISSQRLSINGDGFSVQNSTYDVFRPSIPLGMEDQAFSLENGVLHWRNAGFVGGQALFCNLGGFVAAIYDGVYPTGCPPIRLAQVPLNGQLLRLTWISS